jgi:hypothetical protein
MKKSTIFIFIMFFVSTMNATVPSPKTHLYFTEYLKPVAGMHLYSLNAIFFVKITSQQAEAILRAELESIVKNFSPKFDILATAWYSPTGNEIDEKIIEFPNGKKFLTYSVKTKTIDYLEDESYPLFVN